MFVSCENKLRIEVTTRLPAHGQNKEPRRRSRHVGMKGFPGKSLVVAAASVDTPT
jgi:hypothetical protein